MTTTHHHKGPPPQPEDAERGRRRGADRAPGERPERPLTAAQLAAPSTRRWRRAGRFAPTTG